MDIIKFKKAVKADFKRRKKRAFNEDILETIIESEKKFDIYVLKYLTYLK